MPFVVGVDVGGTFTDCVIMDDAGHIALGKDLSTPPDFSRGIVDSVRTAAAAIGLNLEQLLKQTSFFLHSTTVAENAVVTGEGAKAGLLTTRGFEDTLVMTRGGYGRWAGLTEEEIKHPVRTDKLPPIIPRSLIRGVRERTDYKGAVVLELDRDEAKRAVQELIQSGAEAIGVCFLWSFANANNELAIKEMIRQVDPNVFVTLSSEVAPVLGEYERTSTVALNSYLGPPVHRYLSGLKQQLEASGFRGTLLIMQAYGGLVPLAQAAVAPVGLIESGPVGGLVGSKFLGSLLGAANIIATDMGGTTFKVGVIREGLIEYQREPMVLRYHYLIPKVDVVSIGAGGGSVVWLEPRTGVPRVGPRSAGANPGPICYNFGGEEPTVTDVDLILGYLDPKYFLGGRMKLNSQATLRHFKARIADPLGLDVIEAAAAIYKITNAQIYDLLHKVTVERGLDPRDHVMFVYGGAAGVHAGVYGAELGVRQIVVPHTASVHGAFGLAASEIVHEHALSRRVRLPARVEEVAGILADLTAKAQSQLHSEGFEESQIMLSYAFDMRYRRQVHVLTVPVDVPESTTQADLERAFRDFETSYEQRYGKGSAYREAGAEIVAFRLRATGLLRKPEPFRSSAGGREPRGALIDTRDVYFEKHRGQVRTEFFDFGKLEAGNEISGPAVILTPVTTIALQPSQDATIDPYKNVVITP